MELRKRLEWMEMQVGAGQETTVYVRWLRDGETEESVNRRTPGVLGKCGIVWVETL